MMKIVWRFNLAAGVEEGPFFAWLRDNVWVSSAKFGCRTSAFRLDAGAHAYSTEAVWPDDAARAAWQASADRESMTNYPGFDSPWAAQADLEMTVYRELSA